MNRHALTFDHVCVSYQEQPVLHDITTTITTGTMTGIIGPNGAGKTTLVKTIMHQIIPTTGSIKIFNTNFATIKTSIAYIPQHHAIDWHFPIDVLGVVLMGTYAQLSWCARPGKREYHIAYEALNIVGLQAYAHHPIGHLSGGQKQRVFLARALAQQACLFILDEPLVGLDMQAQRIVIDTLHQLQREGKTIIMIHHDLYTAPHYFDHVLLLNKTIVAHGTTNAVLTKHYIQRTYHQYVPRNTYHQKGG